MLKDNLKQGNNTEIPRRQFFKVITRVFGGFITLALGIPFINSLVENISNKGNKIYSRLININSVPKEKPINLPFAMTEKDAFIKTVQPENVWAVKNSNSETKVFSPICPHLGCRYQWHSERKLFICPCHHSVFNIEGKVISGPSPRPLDTLPTKIRNNYLYVLWERFKPGITKKELI